MSDKTRTTMPILKVMRCRTVKMPSRGTKDSSGIDFFIPEDLKSVSATPTESNSGTVEVYGGVIDINPNFGILIPTGIKTIIRPGYDLVFDNKSGIAVKKGLVIGAKVIDSDYRGEVHIHLINTSEMTQSVRLGDKVAQAVLREVVLADPVEVLEEHFLAYSETERGEGGFGSTGR